MNTKSCLTFVFTLTICLKLVSLQTPSPTGSNTDFIQNTQQNLLQKLGMIMDRLHNASAEVYRNSSTLDSANFNRTRDKINEIVNRLRQPMNVSGIMQIAARLNETSMIINDLPLPIKRILLVGSSLAEFVDLAGLANPLASNTLSLNNYQPPSATDLSNFWAAFASKYPSFGILVETLRLNGSAISFFQSLIEIPTGSQGKENIMAKLSEVFNSYTRLIPDILAIAQANDSSVATLNATILIRILPIARFLTCRPLRFINFNQIMLNMDITKSIDSETFEKIIRCNPKFLLDAVSQLSSNSTSLDDGIMTTLTSLYYDYINLLQNTDPTTALKSLGYLVRYLPSTKIQDLLTRAGNASFSALFKDMNMASFYQNLPDDFRKVLAKSAIQYIIREIGNRTVTSDEWNMIGKMLPDIQPETLQGFLIANQNYRTILSRANNIEMKFWTERCDISLNYVKAIAKAIAYHRDLTVSLSSLKPLLVCKNDCDFRDLNFIFANNSFDTARAVIEGLRSDVAPLCQMTVGKYLRPVSLANITTEYLQRLGRIPLTAVFTQREISQFDRSLIRSSLDSLANSTVDFELAKQFRAESANMSIERAGSLIIGQSMDYFMNKSSTEIRSAVGTLTKYLPELSQPIKAQIVRKFLDGATKSNFLTLMRSLDKETAEIVSLDVCKQMNLTLEDINQADIELPSSCTSYIANKAFKNKRLSDINSTDFKSISKILAYVPPSALRNLTVSNPIDVIADLTSQGKELQSFTRRELFKMLVNSFKAEAGSTPDLYLTKFTDAVIQRLDGDFFIEMPEAELKEFVKLPQFITVINVVSKISAERCCNFPLRAKQRFAEYALQAMGKAASTAVLTRDDLDTLGILLVSSFNMSMINKIELQAIADRLPFFQGFCFQISKSEVAAFSAILERLKSLAKYAGDLDSLLIDLGDLTMYLQDFSAFNSSSLTNLLAAVSIIKDTKDVNSPMQFKCRPPSFSTDDNTDVKNKTKALNKVVINLVKQMKASTAVVGRKKRQSASNPYTCAELQSLKGTVADVPAEDLQNVAVAETIACIETLGAISTWDSSQLSAIVSDIKSNYGGSLANISDTVIGQMNYLCLGFTSSELSQFKITTLDTVQVLGQISTWSSEQVTVLASSIKTTFGLSSSTLIAMNNLVCGLSSTDVGSIALSDLSNSLTILSQVSTCSSMTAWFTRVQQLYTNVQLYTPEVISLIGTLLTGISQEDFTTRLSEDLMPYISTTAFTAFPVSTLNAMTETQIASLTSDQINPLLNSAKASALSEQIKLKLDSQANVDVTVRTSTTTTTGNTSSTIKMNAILIAIAVCLLISVY